VIESYGMTERSMITINPLPPARRKVGSVGLPVDVEIAIVAEDGTRLPPGVDGEIVVRAPEGIAGSRGGVRSGPLTSGAANGWFHTGDQGHLDGEGFLYVTGRLSEVINRGGQKIAPREIDDALLEHPDVLEAAAFGVPHPSLGQDLAAAVVLAKGSNIDSLVLREYLFERLSMQKVPSQILITEAIPKSAAGKVRRQTLHDAFADRLSGSHVDPQTDTERTIARIVRDVLGCPAVGAHDNFFSLGGDSLHAARAIARINAQFDSELPLASLFSHPEVRRLAAEVDAALGARAVRLRELSADIAAMSDDEVARLIALEDATHERLDKHN
jgi:acyl carrier protein